MVYGVGTVEQSSWNTCSPSCGIQCPVETGRIEVRIIKKKSSNCGRRGGRSVNQCRYLNERTSRRCCFHSIGTSSNLNNSWERGFPFGVWPPLFRPISACDVCKVDRFRLALMEKVDNIFKNKMREQNLGFSIEFWANAHLNVDVKNEFSPRLGR